MQSDNTLVESCSIVANAKRLALSLNTHYDSMNCEFSWWVGNTKHRVDFQPMKSNEITVTFYQDSYPFFGKLFSWAYYTLLRFPYVATSTFDTPGVFSEPVTETNVLSILSKVAITLSDSKLRSARLGRQAKKIEVLSAGIEALSKVSDALFSAALDAIPSLKTGRPKHSKKTGSKKMTKNATKKITKKTQVGQVH